VTGHSQATETPERRRRGGDKSRGGGGGGDVKPRRWWQDPLQTFGMPGDPAAVARFAEDAEKRVTP